MVLIVECRFEPVLRAEHGVECRVPSTVSSQSREPVLRAEHGTMVSRAEHPVESLSMVYWC